ncbi:MAG: NAD-dependent epimerase/dehydratase family protein [Bacteroidota bacterium]|nr:NAD-dependent epimerase/dehydratase family protein [Bacteroidota bacterium]MDP4247839.1 NAD-dependent epimerase/dehydratase family protein [Bacteroidota bacterium]MDP4260778.1 NAD-dependent epimerase/dehydratase family protein [Bacteroidota bacterium]
MSIHTILGAGGAIANGLAKELSSHDLPLRLVSRNPHAGQPGGATIVKADMTDSQQALQAIQGSSIVYLCIGLKYDYRVWREQWPKIMNNTIEACKRTQSKLIFFDNVYMYGPVQGAMTEETPYNPSSRKGDLRARLATQLMSEVRKGHIVASIARSADFYGPGADKTSVPGLLVFDRLVKGKAAQWLVNTRVRHSYTYTEDAVKALYLLATDESSWNQAWHLPTADNPLTGAEFIESAAKQLGVASRSSVLPKWMIGLGGLFDRTTAELREMLYQYEFEYLFDSSKFEKAYSFRPTTYEQGIAATAKAFLSGAGQKK